MIGLALGMSAVLGTLGAILRFGGASLVRTHRADALRDAAAGTSGAARVADLLEDPLSIQPAVGIIHSSLLVAAAIPAAWALSAMAAGWVLLGSLVAVGAVLVLGGEVVPRALGRAMPGRPAYRLSRPLSWAVRTGIRAADALTDDEQGETTDEEDEQEHEEQIELISSVLEFTDAIVREVMVPRIDMVTVSSAADSGTALAVVVASGRSRIPVTGDNLDDVLGVLYARDLLRFQDSGAGPAPVRSLMRPAHFVPQTKRVSELLRELQREKVHLAIVVDEFGGTAGLVTIEDLIEEIVGEISDEYDTEELMIEESDDGYLIDARLSVEDLSALVGMRLPDDDWDTVGGLILGLAGRVPEEGETFEVEGLRLTAERVQGRRVSRVRVTVG
ncbi:MAG TPA: HlyC/CorC family transporter [Actinobacteria bacterium]|nr:HlyC/CorC family transporter [Actinomycetota bacterium]